MTATLTLDDVLALIQPDPQAVADGKRRMTDIWHDRATDSLPILFSAPAPAGLAASDMIRHVEDAEQMLYDAAVAMVCLARAGSDAQLAVRADTGTGTLASTAGCRLLSSEYSLPWTTHLPRAEVEAFDPAADLASLGVMPRVRELYAFFRERLPECVHFFCADTQSPFDLAHLLWGDDLFYAIYDEPDFVHALMEKATALYITGTKIMKEWIGEPLDGGYHMNMSMANGGARSCEDTATLLNAESIAEFASPYRNRALAAFGGGWIHYCGNNDALYADAVACPWARGLNFGNPERHDFAVVLPQLIAAGKCYTGAIPRDTDEPLAAYFRRVVSYTAGAHKGLIFTPELRGNESAEPERVVGTWREAQ